LSADAGLFRAAYQSYHGIGKLDWGYGPAGGEPIIFGSDVLVMKDDKITTLYAFINPGKK
jgi:hypothetical protein